MPNPILITADEVTPEMLDEMRRLMGWRREPKDRVLTDAMDAPIFAAAVNAYLRHAEPPCQETQGRGVVLDPAYAELARMLAKGLDASEADRRELADHLSAAIERYMEANDAADH